MSNRAVQEHLGGGIHVGALSGEYKLRRPNGVNGARAYLFDWTGSGTIVMPDASDLSVGTTILVVSDPGSAATPDIDDYDGTLIGTLSAGFAASITLVGAGTAAGVWLVKTHAADIGAAPVNSSNPVYEFTIGTTTFDFDLRAELIASYGYDGVTPCEVTVHITSGVVVGCTQSTGAAFTTEGMPSTSSLVLDLQSGSYIAGKGGAAGPGGGDPATVSSNGGDGSTGLRTTIDTALVGAGTIQGGGGGGGGGRWLSGVPGGGGGGGSGWQPGQGGSGGVIAATIVAGNVGLSGTLLAGGAGGAALSGGNDGSTGAAPGVQANPVFGLVTGGFGGDAVVYTTGITYDKTGFSGSIKHTESAV